MVGKTESIIGSGLLKAMPYLDTTEITLVVNGGDALIVVSHSFSTICWTTVESHNIELIWTLSYFNWYQIP